jgi:hypothetical protein
MYEARNSVEIARSRGADNYAPDIISKAEGGLKMAEDELASKAKKKEIIWLAPDRTAIRRCPRAYYSKKRSASQKERAEAAANAKADAEAKAAVEAREAKRAVGLGKSMPVADNGASEGRQKNRRVEIMGVKDREERVASATRDTQKVKRALS